MWDTRQVGLDVGLAGNPDEHVTATGVVNTDPHAGVGPLAEAVRAGVTEVDLVGAERVAVGREPLVRGREIAGVVALGGERPAEDAASDQQTDPDERE